MSTQSIGTALVKSAGWAGRAPMGKEQFTTELPDVDVKTLMTTAAGWAPETHREAGAVPIAVRPLSLLDLLTQTPTKSAPVTYMEETTETSNAAEVAEGGTYGEAAFAFTPRSANVGKISVWLPVTDEQLEDDEEAARFVDERLPFLLRQRLEGQVLTGNGTLPNLRGILNTAGIATQALGTDTRPVAIRKAITKVQTPGYGVPNAVVMHPTDAEDIDLAAAVDLSAPFLDTSSFWNLPRIVTDGITLGTALVGDFANFVGLRIRRGITLTVSNSHGTFFTEGKQAIRADIRVAVPVYRPTAFCSVTGI